MNTKRDIIGEVEQMAVDAIVHQPDERKAAERHFSDVAKKIVETALQAVDIMDVGDVCRRAVTGAAIQDYDLLAKLLTDKDFDHERLAKAIEDRLLARAAEEPIDYPTYFTPGWLGEIAKWLAAKGTASGQQQGRPTDDELHEAATEEPTTAPSTKHQAPGTKHQAPSYLDFDFCGMKLACFGGKGIESKFIGKRVNPNIPDNHDQIFEITVRRPNAIVGSVAEATENGELLFRIESMVRFEYSKYMAVKCLRALLSARIKSNRHRHDLRSRHRKAKAAKAGEVA